MKSAPVALPSPAEVPLDYSSQVSFAADLLARATIIVLF